MGRPLKNVDEKRVIELASKGLAVKEIAALENCSESTINTRFHKALEKGWSICNASLKRKQYERAMGGSDTMLIWLGKNRLEQTDKAELKAKLEHEITDLSKLSDEQLIELERLVDTASPKPE